MLAELIHFVASIGPIRRVLRRWQGKGAILCFHRVIPSQMLEVDASPTRNLSFDATKFRMLLAALKKEYQFVSLDRFLDSDQVGKEHRSQIAVTFDDGYRDYLDYALPILDALNIPSTIFLTTRFLESDRSMWWYELRDFIAEAKSIEISHAGKSRIRNCRTTHEKCRCFIEIRALIMQMSDQELNHFMVEFTGKRYRKEYPEICMDWNDVRRIDSNPLVTVGSHGWAHLNYSYETREVVLEDMVRSKLLIEKI